MLANVLDQKDKTRNCKVCSVVEPVTVGSKSVLRFRVYSEQHIWGGNTSTSLNRTFKPKVNVPQDTVVTRYLAS